MRKLEGEWTIEFKKPIFLYNKKSLRMLVKQLKQEIAGDAKTIVYKYATEASLKYLIKEIRKQTKERFKK
jgi:hypothetical protein